MRYRIGEDVIRIEDHPAFISNRDQRFVRMTGLQLEFSTLKENKSPGSDYPFYFAHFEMNRVRRVAMGRRDMTLIARKGKLDGARDF